MTAFQVMPALSDEEYDTLREDIRAHGIRVPVDVDEAGALLDGHHRAQIADELAVPCPRRVVPGLSQSQKVQHALAVNAHRRHLTGEQRRGLIAVSLRADPEASDREHARRVGVSHVTVAAVRADLAESGEIPHFTHRLDPRTGHASQPATRPPPRDPAAADGMTPIGVSLQADPQASVEESGQVDHFPTSPPRPTPTADETRRREQQEADDARAEALAARVDSLDRAVDFLTEFAQWPERVAELRDAYTPLYPSNPVTTDKIRLALDGLDAFWEAWK